LINPRFEAVLTGATLNSFEGFIVGAIRLGSSDVHLEPMANFLRIRVRVEGDLVELARIPNPPSKKTSHPFVLQIKARAGMQPYSKHPEDGRLDFEYNGRNLSLRVATIPQVFGEKAVLRIFDIARVQSLDGLGFRPNNLDRLKRMAGKGSGMVLVVGPTGSGKTTTLYAALSTPCSITSTTPTAISSPWRTPSNTSWTASTRSRWSRTL
jgi:type IV pilus assembly protein PilB